jgi:plasmid stability protein
MSDSIKLTLSPTAMAQLQARAQQSGRTVEAEAQAIVVHNLAPQSEETILDNLQQQLNSNAQRQGHDGNPVPIPTTAFKSNLQVIWQRLKEIGRHFSLGGLSVHEAREIGRRY